MARFVLFLLAPMVIMHHAPAWGQFKPGAEIASSPNPVGSGARALGMGGAFIGVADDATAASWNPGGLIQLETPEISVVGAYNSREEETDFKAFPEASGSDTVTNYELNYLSAAYPFALFRTNMIASLNLQHLYDFDRKHRFRHNIQEQTSPLLERSSEALVKLDQEGDYRALSPAFAVQITPRVSVGCTLNFWNHGLDESKWKSNYRRYETGTETVTGTDYTFEGRTTRDEEFKMNGMGLEFNPSEWRNINFNLGLMWNINRIFTLGAVFKSPFEARLDHSYDLVSTETYPDNPLLNRGVEEHVSDVVTVDMPMSYGLGLAARLSDELTLDLDVYRTDWSNYVLHDGDGDKVNPVTATDNSEADIDDTTQVRLGGEYLIIHQKWMMIFPIRAGVFYDPEPAQRSPDDFYGASVGTGVAYKRFVYDIAYQYRFGRDVRKIDIDKSATDQDVDQHTVYMSLIVHF